MNTNFPSHSKHQIPFPVDRLHQQVLLGTPGVHSRSVQAEQRKKRKKKAILLTLRLLA
jgi:inosine/xanthosine triphosphate pyrophosphatase family protein